MICSVLTKVGVDDRRVMCEGFVTELGLKQNDAIDYVILNSASRFLLRVGTRRVTTSPDRTRIARSDRGDLLLIDGDEIANVHFGVFSLELKAPAAAEGSREG